MDDEEEEEKSQSYQDENYYFDPLINTYSSMYFSPYEARAHWCLSEYSLDDQVEYNHNEVEEDENYS